MRTACSVMLYRRRRHAAHGGHRCDGSGDGRFVRRRGRQGKDEDKMHESGMMRRFDQMVGNGASRAKAAVRNGPAPVLCAVRSVLYYCIVM